MANKKSPPSDAPATKQNASPAATTASKAPVEISGEVIDVDDMSGEPILRRQRFYTPETCKIKEMSPEATMMNQLMTLFHPELVFEPELALKKEFLLCVVSKGLARGMIFAGGGTGLRYHRPKYPVLLDTQNVIIGSEVFDKEKFKREHEQMTADGADGEGGGSSSSSKSGSGDSEKKPAGSSGSTKTSSSSSSSSSSAVETSRTRTAGEDEELKRSSADAAVAGNVEAVHFDATGGLQEAQTEDEEKGSYSSSHKMDSTSVEHDASSSEHLSSAGDGTTTVYKTRKGRYLRSEKLKQLQGDDKRKSDSWNIDAAISALEEKLDRRERDEAGSSTDDGGSSALSGAGEQISLAAQRTTALGLPPF
ncbi:unnamed protein product, partial [Amoebophrya sp. A120]|eukprot:GSA120T00010751001.1